jgi:hypothetical protein
MEKLMKKVKGWWLPDSDNHFEKYITDGGYQTAHRTTILNHIFKTQGWALAQQAISRNFIQVQITCNIVD